MAGAREPARQESFTRAMAMTNAQAAHQSVMHRPADAIAISGELMDQRDVAREQAVRNAKILAEIKAAQEYVEAEKQLVPKCAKSNQQVMNQAFGSYGRELNEARLESARLRQEIHSLKGED